MSWHVSPHDFVVFVNSLVLLDDTVVGCLLMCLPVSCRFWSGNWRSTRCVLSPALSTAMLAAATSVDRLRIQLVSFAPLLTVPPV